MWLKYSPVIIIFLWISGQYLPVSVQTTTSGAKNQGAPEQKPNSSFPNIYQKVSEPEYRQPEHNNNISSTQAGWATIIAALCHAHTPSVSHSLTQCPPLPSPTWWADVLLCETLSLGSHQWWRWWQWWGPWWWVATPQPPAWSHRGQPKCSHLTPPPWPDMYLGRLLQEITSLPANQEGCEKVKTISPNILT